MQQILDGLNNQLVIRISGWWILGWGLAILTAIAIRTWWLGRRQ